MNKQRTLGAFFGGNKGYTDTATASESSACKEDSKSTAALSEKAPKKIVAIKKHPKDPEGDKAEINAVSPHADEAGASGTILGAENTNGASPVSAVAAYEPNRREKGDSPAHKEPTVKKRRIVKSDEESGGGASPPRKKQDSAKKTSSSNGQTTCQGSDASQKAIASSSKIALKSEESSFRQRALPAVVTRTDTRKGKVKAKASDEDIEAMSDANSSAEESAFEFESEGEAEEDEAGLAPVEEKKAAKKIAAIFLKKAPENKTKAGWKAGDPVPYSALTETFEKIEATTKRLEILQHLTLLLQQVSERSPDNLLRIVYLCINRLCPDYEGLELGIGESLLMKAIAQSTGREMSRIRKELEQKGDLGLVAVASRQEQPTMFKAAKLSVPTVFKSLKEIAQLTGNKSQDRKIGIIMKLLAACQGEETKYLIRSLEGKLRIGLAEKSVVVALAQAIIYSKQVNKKLSEAALAAKLDEGTATVRAVFSELPSYDLIVPALLEYGVEGLRDHCKLTPGVPLKPMLAKPTKAIGEVLDRFEGKAFTCEYKYDGERAQVHYLENGQLAIFSRNSENMSVKYPDLIESVPKIRKADKDVKSFCLDCEAVAWKMPEFDESGTQTGGGHLLPFQELARRKRKDVKVEDIKVKVKLFAFDILYLNGEPLLHLDLATRRKLLHENFQPVENEFDFARSEDCTTVEEIQTFLDASVKDSCEGLMVKMLNGAASTYAPSQRSQNWLKLKKDYLAGTGDSLDLIVVGAFYGKGKRTNVYGAFLLACYDADTETYQSICKIGTGFSEEQLLQFYQLLKPLELSNKKGYYDMGDAKPDVFFEPQVIFEVLTADLSLSPVYTAGKGAVDQRGISLRFPRFIRLRDDKGPEDTTSPEQIIEMYQRQQAVSNGRTKGGDDEDGFW